MESGDEIGAVEAGGAGGSSPDADGAPVGRAGVSSGERTRASVPRLRAPVMSDVGRLAGVSHQTVSRVINGSLHVRPDTRAAGAGGHQELG